MPIQCSIKMNQSPKGANYTYTQTHQNLIQLEHQINIYMAPHTQHEYVFNHSKFMTRFVHEGCFLYLPILDHSPYSLPKLECVGRL